MTGDSTPGKRSDTMPLNSGTSTADNLAMFMSFIDNSNNYTHTYTDTYRQTCIVDIFA